MSTNYYARIIPSHKRKKELYNAIEANDFPLVNRLTKEMYGSLERDWDSEDSIGGVVHLGKRAGGWKFLWNPNVFPIRHGHSERTNGTYKWIEEPNTALYTYPLTKKGLHDFIFRDDVRIYDEYDELQDKEEFWNMALSWGYDKDNEGWDTASYEDKYTSYTVTGELTDLLKSEGFKFTSLSNSEFYSDGLRFAGFTDFS